MGYYSQSVALLDDEAFLDIMMALEARCTNFNSVALYTRMERRKQTYSLDRDKWKEIKYFDKDEDGSAGLIFHMNDGGWLLLELSSVGFYWCYRMKEDSKRIKDIPSFRTTETHRHDVPIEFLRRLISEQKDRCYERGRRFWMVLEGVTVLCGLCGVNVGCDFWDVRMNDDVHGQHGVGGCLIKNSS